MSSPSHDGRRSQQYCHAIPAKRPRSRIDLVDALRGSALLGLLLLHCVEHFGVAHYARQSPAWLKQIDAATIWAAHYLMADKAYAIFALLFGFSFFLILDGAAQRGVDGRGRYLWRLGVLGIIGYLHCIIYRGDFLLVLALVGLPLVLFYYADTKLIGILAAILLLLPGPSLWKALGSLSGGHVPAQILHWEHSEEMNHVYVGGSFAATCAFNLWKGQMFRFWYTIESGRYLHMAGLFLCGLLLGRSRVFEDSIRSLRFGRRVAILGLVGLAIYYLLKHQVGSWGFSGMARHTLGNVARSYRNLSQMALWLGGFVWLYCGTRVRPLLLLLAPYGRMSLTSYVAQAVVGVPLFYGFGLALFRNMGPFYSILYGVAFFVIQCTFAHLWLMRFYYGPLEWLWRAATFLSFAIPMRKLDQKQIPESAPAAGSRYERFW